MFDSMVDEELELGVMSGDQLAAAIVDNHTELLRRECRVLELACAWADWHDATGMGLEYAPLVERACMFGGPGTPWVSEFCVTELGALQGTGPMAARALVADALDLRYRLPMLWKQVQAGQVRAWQARKVAEQTRPLSWDACVELDAAISGFLGDDDLVPVPNDSDRGDSRCGSGVGEGAGGAGPEGAGCVGL